jgi:hypothetical protein
MEPLHLPLGPFYGLRFKFSEGNPISQDKAFQRRAKTSLCRLAAASPSRERTVLKHDRFVLIHQHTLFRV